MGDEGWWSSARSVAVARAGRKVPPRGYAAFAATVPRALAAVGAVRYDASLVTTGAAVAAALLVWIFLLRALRGGRTRPGARRTARPRVA